jgi:lipopolysaccharide export system permease protein
MGSTGRYIFRATLTAFLVVVVSLTALMWVTQALREIDLMTNQGQNALVFVAITGLIVPLLVLVIAPLAFVIAVIHVLNRLGTDSEIIVMNASGMSPWRLFQPFLAMAIVVSILVAVLSAYAAPEGLRNLRRRLTEVRTDLVSNIVQPGRFINVQSNVTFHIRAREPNGELLGVLIDDQRDPKEHVSILAERGEIVKNERGTFLVLEGGNVQRHETGQVEPTIVVFDRYAFDLSQFSDATIVKYSVRERYLWQLISPDADDVMATTQPGQFRAELHDRIISPLYPLAFVVICYAYLGAPRTTRQSRTLSLVSAVALVSVVRLIGFASIVFSVHMPLAIIAQYIALIAAVVFGLWAIGRGIIIEPPAFIANMIAALGQRFAKPAAAT